MCIKCDHNKVYAPFMKASLPPQQPWICSKCGDEGVDRGVHVSNWYESLQRAKEAKTDAQSQA